MPLISFIIPYYNEPISLLTNCINSILSIQSANSEIEIIVIDDGSKASPKTQLESMSRHIIYKYQNNQGPASARNHGIELAKGEYIQFVDTDDCLLSDCYSDCIQLLKKNSPDILMFNERKAFLGTGKEYLLSRNVRSAVWGYVFRKKILNGLSLNSRIIFCEDELFTPQLILKANNVYATSISPYVYFQRNNSLTHTKERIQERLSNSLYAITSLVSISKTLSKEEKVALERRINQLVMDHLYISWRLTHRPSFVTKKIKELKSANLLPLPVKYYTIKYFAFSIATHLL